MKRLSTVIQVLVVLGVMGTLCSPALAIDYDICGKALAIEGYFRQEFSFNVNDSSDLKTNQTGLQSAYQIWYLDTNLELTPNFEVRGIFRMWGDLIYAIRHDHGHFERRFESARSNQQWDDDFNQVFREFYVTYYSDKFLVRIGKQQVGWGQADGLRLIDIINPLDARKDFLFYDTEGYEEVRIPKWMLKTEVYPGNIGPFVDIGVEFYWNPGDIKEFGELLPNFVDANLHGGYYGAYPTEMPQQWGPWAPPTNFAPFGVRLFKKERSTSIDNSEYGARIKFSCKDTLITLNYWQGFNSDSVLAFRGLSVDPAAVGPLPIALNFDREYKRIKVAGFTLSRELFGVGKMTCQVANPVLRVEALYSFDQTFNTRLVAPPFTFFPTTEKDQIRYMIGFDWAMNFRLINPRKSTFVSGQFFHIRTLDYDGGANAPVQLAPYDWRWPKNQFYATLLLRTEYKNEQIVPSILAVHDFHSQAAWIKSKLYFRIGDHWRPEIGYLWIKRNSDHTSTQDVPADFSPPVRMGDDWKSFGLFENRDQVYVRIQYQF